MSDVQGFTLDALSSLDLRSLEAVEKLFMQILLAVELRKARLSPSHQEVDNKKLFKLYSETGKKAFDLIQSGADKSETFSRLARETSYPYETISAWYDHHLKLYKKALGQRVFAAASSGMSNDEIAAQEGMHRSSVSRTLKAEIRRRREASK